MLWHVEASGFPMHGERLSAIEGLLADAVAPAHLRRRPAGLLLAQHADDLSSLNLLFRIVRPLLTDPHYDRGSRRGADHRESGPRPYRSRLKARNDILASLFGVINPLKEARWRSPSGIGRP